MAYEDEYKRHLVRAAELAEVDVERNAKKEEIIEALESAGNDYEHYEAFLKPQILSEERAEEAAKEAKEQETPREVSPVRPGTAVTSSSLTQTVQETLDEEEEEAVTAKAVKAPAGVTLFRMTRPNPHYEVRGYKFTRQHPFAVVKDEDAEALMLRGGFRPASPREIEEFYA